MLPMPPFSVYIADDDYLYPGYHVGSGANGHASYGILSRASLANDASLHLEFEIPDPIPQGNPKLILVSIANATSGNAKVGVNWASVAYGEDPSSATLNSEGTQTITWTAGDADDYIRTAVALDAASWGTGNAGEILVVHVDYEYTSWTLAQAALWQFWLVWE